MKTHFFVTQHDVFHTFFAAYVCSFRSFSSDDMFHKNVIVPDSCLISFYLVFAYYIFRHLFHNEELFYHTVKGSGIYPGHCLLFLSCSGVITCFRSVEYYSSSSFLLFARYTANVADPVTDNAAVALH